MADWFVSSAVYATISAWQASHAYSVGDIIKPVTPPANSAYVYRCTTAGTSAATEPGSWATTNNGTTASGGATFTNVTGQSTYGWSAAGGTIYTMANAVGNRAATGDRLFVSSDHSETNTASTPTYNFGSAGYGLVQIISVNRAGSVPPVSADVQKGASVTGSSGTLALDTNCSVFWQGVTITHSGTSDLRLVGTGAKELYFKDCALAITGASTTSRLTSGSRAKIVFDNTTVQFSNASQFIGGATAGVFNEIVWINTPSAIQGATLPTSLFSTDASGCGLSVTCRGVDLSALTGTLLGGQTSAWQGKVLLDSCRIASGLTRWSGGSSTAGVCEEVELVNCYDGTIVTNERHTAAGSVVMDHSTYLNGGAADDGGNYSLRAVSTSRSDFAVFPVDCFAFDVENTVVGASKTATVEVMSSPVLNNNDIRLLLEYMGTSGNPVASFGDSLSSMLASASALPSSSSTWTGPVSTTWNPGDLSLMTLSNNNLTATSTGAGGGARAVVGFNSGITGKYYWEITASVWANSATQPVMVGPATSAFNGTAWIYLQKSGVIAVNGVGSGSSLGARSAGDIIGVAFDFGAQLFWMRVAPSGNWNGSGTANPATGTGGIAFGAITGVLFPGFFAFVSGEAVIANFGATAFSGTVPSGFTAGWPGLPASKQLLQVTFTPQRAGRVRGLVRLGKPTTTVWVNPQITIS